MVLSTPRPVRDDASNCDRFRLGVHNYPRTGQRAVGAPGLSEPPINERPRSRPTPVSLGLAHAGLGRTLNYRHYGGVLELWQY